MRYFLIVRPDFTVEEVEYNDNYPYSGYLLEFVRCVQECLGGDFQQLIFHHDDFKQIAYMRKEQTGQKNVWISDIVGIPVCGPVLIEHSVY